MGDLSQQNDQLRIGNLRIKSTLRNVGNRTFAKNGHSFWKHFSVWMELRVRNFPDQCFVEGTARLVVFRTSETPEIFLENKGVCASRLLRVFSQLGFSRAGRSPRISIFAKQNNSPSYHLEVDYEI